jgi:hypothetical protein
MISLTEAIVPSTFETWVIETKRVRSFNSSPYERVRRERAREVERYQVRSDGVAGYAHEALGQTRRLLTGQAGLVQTDPDASLRREAG